MILAFGVWASGLNVQGLGAIECSVTEIGALKAVSLD